MTKRIDIVVPVYNEEGNIEPLFTGIAHVFETALPAYDYHVIFVDDGSTDASVMRIMRVAQNEERVRSIELSRNFGKEAALTAGMAHADADAVILIDADLQHPPALIPELVAKWERGADVVIGVRRKSSDEDMLRKLGSKAFAYIMNEMGGVPSVPGATDFRLMDRIVVDEFKQFTERGRVTRGLIDWLGFTRAYVEFDAAKRHAGVAQYSFRKLVALAFDGLVSNSLLPLRFAGYLGMPITLFAGGLGLFILFEQVVLQDPLNLQVPGTAMLAVMILFLNGILLISLGLVSLYIEKIHHEAANRPLFVVRKSREISV